MSPDEILSSIHQDLKDGKRTALVALASLATEHLAADAEHRSVLDSDIGVADHVFARIIRRVVRAETALSRAVGYHQQSPTEAIDEVATNRIIKAIGNLADAHDEGDPDWQKKVMAMIDRQNRPRVRWWRRFARWLRGQ